MARPKTDSIHTATPERILAAAELAFATHGSKASLADIAARAGIRRPSLLYHFPSKEALYEAVVTRTFHRLGAELAAAMATPGTFAARLEALLRTFATFLMVHPHYAQIVVRELLEQDGPGQAILSSEVAPLLDGVVLWLQTEGAATLPADLPVREAVLHVASNVLLSAGAGPLRAPMWGELSVDRQWAVSRALFLRSEV